MRRAAWLLLALPLAACGQQTVKAPQDYDLSGTVAGDWGAGDRGAEPRLRLSLVGVGVPSVVTKDDNQPQNVVKGAAGWSFGLDLPRTPDLAGVYQVIAYDDANNSGSYDVGERVARNRVWLVYSVRGGETPAVTVPAGLPWSGEEAIPALTVREGWNVYDRNSPLSASNPYAGPPTQKVTGYALSR